MHAVVVGLRLRYSGPPADCGVSTTNAAIEAAAPFSRWGTSSVNVARCRLKSLSRPNFHISITKTKTRTEMIKNYNSGHETRLYRLMVWDTLIYFNEIE